jgi:hypothetical protein
VFLPFEARPPAVSAIRHAKSTMSHDLRVIST